MTARRCQAAALQPHHGSRPLVLRARSLSDQSSSQVVRQPRCTGRQLRWIAWRRGWSEVGSTTQATAVRPHCPRADSTQKPTKTDSPLQLPKLWVPPSQSARRVTWLRIPTRQRNFVTCSESGQHFLTTTGGIACAARPCSPCQQKHASAAHLVSQRQQWSTADGRPRMGDSLHAKRRCRLHLSSPANT